MNQRIFTMCAALACAIFAIALAPTTPAATAGLDHDFDEEAQLWYDFAHDKAQEINLLQIRTNHSLEHKTLYAFHNISSHCCFIRIPCDETRQAARRRSIARRAIF
jgi:hypothetical protein